MVHRAPWTKEEHVKVAINQLVGSTSTTGLGYSIFVSLGALSIEDASTCPVCYMDAWI
ncbi:hypothetical protein ACOMHN_025044 [Nucella lapillus]